MDDHSVAQFRTSSVPFPRDEHVEARRRRGDGTDETIGWAPPLKRASSKVRDAVDTRNVDVDLTTENVWAPVYFSLRKDGRDVLTQMIDCAHRGKQWRQSAVYYRTVCARLGTEWGRMASGPEYAYNRFLIDFDTWQRELIARFDSPNPHMRARVRDPKDKSQELHKLFGNINKSAYVYGYVCGQAGRLVQYAEQEDLWRSSLERSKRARTALLATIERGYHGRGYSNTATDEPSVSPPPQRAVTPVTGLALSFDEAL